MFKKLVVIFFFVATLTFISESNCSISLLLQTDQQVLQQLQTIQQLIKNHVPSAADQIKFNKKLLDFDYSDDEDGGNDGAGPTPAMLDMLQNVLSSDQLLRKLKSMGEITDHQIQQLQQLIPQFQAQQQQQQQQQQQPFIRVSPQVTSVFQQQMMAQQVSNTLLKSFNTIPIWLVTRL